MQQCGVLVVEDGELPDGVERVIVERTGGESLLLLTNAVAGSWRLVMALEAERRESASVVELRAV